MRKTIRDVSRNLVSGSVYECRSLECETVNHSCRSCKDFMWTSWSGVWGMEIQPRASVTSVLEGDKWLAQWIEVRGRPTDIVSHIPRTPTFKNFYRPEKIVNCRTKISAIFRGIFKDFSRYFKTFHLFTISFRTLVDKHCRWLLLMYVCTYVCMSACMRTCIYVMYVCMYVCL